MVWNDPEFAENAAEKIVCQGCPLKPSHLFLRFAWFARTSFTSSQSFHFLTFWCTKILRRQVFRFGRLEPVKRGRCYEIQALYCWRSESMRRPSGYLGTCVPVRTILASLAEGGRIEEILKDFPTLTEQDIRVVIAFAAASAKEDLPFAKTPDIQ